jgi:tetratricopeptide (TPR) repeat protein
MRPARLSHRGTILPHRGVGMTHCGKTGSSLPLGLVAAVLLGAASSEHELPSPSSLAGLEPAVQRQLLGAREAVERLLPGSAAASPARRDGDRAAAGATSVAAPDRELAAAYGSLGELYLIYDLTADAEPCLERAASLQPDQPRWPYLLGVLRQGRRDSAGAEAALWASLALAPSDLPALLRLGEVLLDGSRPDDAREVFERALAIDPRSAAALAGLGRAASAAGDHRSAIERFDAALALQPQATSLHYRLAIAHRALGDLEQARAQLGRSGEQPVTFADPVLDAARRRLTGVGALLRIGQSAAGSGAPAAAEARFREALAIDPESADAHQALGTLLEEQGRADEALEHYTEAMRLGLQNVPAGLHTAVLLRAAGRSQEAAALLAATAASAPDSAAVQAELASALEEAGQLDAALAAYDRWSSLEPDPRRRALALFHRSSIEAAQGSGAEAEASLRQALELDPDLAAAHFNLGTLYARRGALDDAAAHLERAVDLRPDDELAALSLGMALVLSDRGLEARRRLEAAVARHPDQPALAHLLARLLAACSDASVREPDRAVAMAGELSRAQPSADHLETLAMSLASASRFAEAAATQERAIAAIEAAGHGDLELARRRLALYRDGQPVLDPWKR